MTTQTTLPLRDTVLNHLVATLDRTPLDRDPFAHVYMREPLPPELYDHSLEMLPHLRLYAPDNPAKYGSAASQLQATPGTSAGQIEGVGEVQSCRYIYPLDDRNLARLDGTTREFWCAVASALTSRELQDHLISRFAPDLMRRFRTDRSGLQHLALYPRATLIRDLTGYWIAPHPDSRAKVITMQFYLARDQSQRDLGTTLYRRRLFDVRNLVTLKHLFEPVKRLEFLPNTAYAFPVTRSSWHGREALPPGEHPRDSLLLVYYLDPAREW